MTDDLVIVLAIFLCILLEGLFSGGEIALIASDIHLIRRKATAGSKAAERTLRLLENPEWFLATCLTGSDICIITSTALATTLCISRFGLARGEVVAVVAMVPLLLIFGEIIPKSIYQQHPERTAMRISRLVWFFSRSLYPLVYIISRISKGAVFAMMGTGGGRPYPYITKEGLKFLLTDRGHKGDVKTSEQEMIRRVIDFSKATAGQIMVPLSNVVALDAQTPLAEAARIIDERGFSRIPVYRGQIINMIGIVSAFDVLKSLPADSTQAVEKYLRPTVFYVPESKEADDLLFEMQKTGEYMAVIVDEYGGAVGVLTIEDILEEIVGEIEDEYDTGEKAYKVVGPGRYLVNARIGIERLKEILPVEIPAGDYETLGGFLLHRMGRIPRRGETLKAGSVTFFIEDADLKSIKEVLVILLPGADGGTERK
jgi:CBS domain containing-hemolysin-like protein